jgi:hypothetical protein
VKLLITPTHTARPQPRVHSAFWSRWLGRTAAASAGEQGARQHHRIAAAEKIDRSYFGRVLRLTLLALPRACGALRR